jgi:hypothetical protein
MAQHEKSEEEIKEALEEGNSLVLSYQTMEKLTLWYHKTCSIKSDQLQDTLAEMHADCWRFDQEVLC